MVNTNLALSLSANNSAVSVYKADIARSNAFNGIQTAPFHAQMTTLNQYTRSPSVPMQNDQAPGITNSSEANRVLETGVDNMQASLLQIAEKMQSQPAQITTKSTPTSNDIEGDYNG